MVKSTPQVAGEVCSGTKHRYTLRMWRRWGMRLQRSTSLRQHEQARNRSSCWRLWAGKWRLPAAQWAPPSSGSRSSSAGAPEWCSGSGAWTSFPFDCREITEKADGKVFFSSILKDCKLSEKMQKRFTQVSQLFTRAGSLGPPLPFVCCSRRCRCDPWVRKIPWQPTPVFLPGEFHGQRSLVGYSPWGCKRAGHDWMTKQQTIHLSELFENHHVPLSQKVSARFS